MFAFGEELRHFRFIGALLKFIAHPSAAAAAAANKLVSFDDDVQRVIAILHSFVGLC